MKTILRISSYENVKNILRKFFSKLWKETKKTRIACPNFGHPAQTLSFTKHKFLQVKNNFETIMNGLPTLKLFQLSNGDLLFS